MEQDARTMREARGRKGLSQADAAGELGVTERTYRRWEGGAAVSKKRDKEALSRLYGRGIFSWDHRNPGSNYHWAEDEPAGLLSSSNKPEVDYLVSQVREKAMRYSIRRAQEAPSDELDRLREELELTVRNGLRAGSGDRQSLDLVVEALVDMLTRENEASRSAQPTKKRKNGSVGKD